MTRRVLGTLTPRQRQCAELLGQGATNKEIALAMTLSLSAVKGLVTGILSSLGVDSRTQAALKLADLGPTNT